MVLSSLPVVCCVVRSMKNLICCSRLLLIVVLIAWLLVYSVTGEKCTIDIKRVSRRIGAFTGPCEYLVPWANFPEIFVNVVNVFSLFSCLFIIVSCRFSNYNCNTMMNKVAIVYAWK